MNLSDENEKAATMARVKALFDQSATGTLPQPDRDRPLNLVTLFDKYGVVAGDHMFFVLDTSGGMEGFVLDKVFQELPDAFRALNLSKLTMVMFDSTITFAETYDVNTIEALRKEYPRGGGGTMFGPVCDIVRTLKTGPGDAKVFVLTDGLFGDAFDPTGLDVTLIARSEWHRNTWREYYNKNGQKFTAPFKQVII